MGGTEKEHERMEGEKKQYLFLKKSKEMEMSGNWEAMG